MADLIVRPDDAPLPRRDARPDTPAVYDTTTPREDSLAERLITTQSPQRPQSTPRIRIEVDGRVVEGFEGQTILEVCRDNGIEIPTLCYEPKLPGFGACRMCVCEVEGEDQPPISCSREAEAALMGKAANEANFKAAAQAALAKARPQKDNTFKVELAKRCLVRSLKTATATA